MKIITANNKTTIKMSKSEWQNIGKKAGWIGAEDFDPTQRKPGQSEYQWARMAIMDRIRNQGMDFDKAAHGYLSRLSSEEIKRIMDEKEQITNEAKTITAKTKEKKKYNP